MGDVDGDGDLDEFVGFAAGKRIVCIATTAGLSSSCGGPASPI
jgi:hypothetical protein